MGLRGECSREHADPTLTFAKPRRLLPPPPPESLEPCFVEGHPKSAAACTMISLSAKSGAAAGGPSVLRSMVRRTPTQREEIT